MKDTALELKVNEIKSSIDKINQSMSELYEQGMEIRINYTDAAGGNPPSITLWRAVAHVDYLK